MTAAAALSVLAVAGTVQSSMAADTAVDAIQSLQAGQFNVVRIDSLDSDEANSLTGINAGAVQAAIHGNASVARELSGQNVQISNVVDAARAANGSVTFYLR